MFERTGKFTAMRYHSHYSYETEIKFGQVLEGQIKSRSNGLKVYGIKCIGEMWIPEYGITALWEGPALDEDEQNLLNLKELRS